MQEFSPSDLAPEAPLPEERAAARNQSGGWLYRIAGGFEGDDAIPPEAICGAWKIDDGGDIIGAFIANPNYDPVRFPPPAAAAPEK